MSAKAVVVALLAATAFVASPAPSASALFSAAAAGSSQSVAQSVPQADAPVAVAVARDVTVSWSATTLSSGTAVTGYVVRRYTPANVLQTVLDDCTTVPTNTCIERQVPIGMWHYTVQARIGSWIGPESAPSASISVANAALVLDSAAPITALPQTVTGLVSQFTLGASLSFRLDSAAGTVLVGSPATVTSSTSMAVSVTLPSGTSDAPHSIVVVDSSGVVASAAVNIAFSPVMQTMRMLDVDANGKVDRVDVDFNEPLASYSAGTAPWTLTNVPSGGTLSSVTVSGNTATLHVAEGAGAANTAVGSFRVALAANAAGIRDAAGNQTAYAATAVTDRAAPALVSLQLRDNNGNGRVDRVTAVFSETLATYSAGVSPFAVANVPSAGTLSSVSRSGTTATLTLAEGVGAADTAVGSMTVAMTASATGIRDAAGNQSSFAARTPTDLARPVPMTVTETNAGINGRAEAGDTVAITFSEALGTASVPATATVTLADPVGAGNDTLSISGITNGARTTGGANYVVGDGTSATWAASSVALSNAGRTVTVTMAGSCVGTACLVLGTQTTNATFSFLSATTLTDVVGNVASTTARTASLRLF